MLKMAGIGFVSFIVGYYIGVSNQPVNIGGYIQPRVIGTGADIKIQFNGYDVFVGELDSSFNGQLIGTWKNEPATAICNSAKAGILSYETTCNINAKNINTNIKFKKG